MKMWNRLPQELVLASSVDCRGGLTIRALKHCPVGGPMKCPWYLFYRLFWVCFECGQGHRGPMIPYFLGAP
ncbi:unnamed protein product [Staurois parvus]|uniref:Uncharacterized protein n=1 Tax=Staurois parvus TaxID=386267 RepID=A0ABN9B853_9NEOB|nr:unnamed protein product [Staurois parvus]